MVSILLFFLILGIVVIFHEFGHFLLARANGIHVVEFAIGMGPTLISFKKGDTTYSLKLLPIGGACMFEGEDGLMPEKEDDEDDDASSEYESEDDEITEGKSTKVRSSITKEKGGKTGSGAFNDASVWGRISTVLAGPVFNFILAYIVAFIMIQYAWIAEPMVTDLMPDGAAIEAGLQKGDKIVALNGETVYLYQEMQIFNQMNQGKPVEITYLRDGQKYVTTVTPKWDEETGRYLVGILNQSHVDITLGNSFKYAWYEVRYSAKSVYKSLLMMIQGKISRKDVAGPVGVANMVGEVYEQTKSSMMDVFINMLNIIMILSVNLGIVNLFPIPALDGGRLVFLLIEAITGKSIPPEKEGLVHFVGFVLLMVLMVFIFFNDINNVFFSK